MKTTIFTSERKTIGRICILLSLCTCLLTSVTCTAQNASDGLSDLPKHEIVFSAGIFPLIGVFYPSYNFNPFLFILVIEIVKKPLLVVLICHICLTLTNIML